VFRFWRLANEHSTQSDLQTANCLLPTRTAASSAVQQIRSAARQPEPHPTSTVPNTTAACSCPVELRLNVDRAFGVLRELCWAPFLRLWLAPGFHSDRRSAKA